MCGGTVPDGGYVGHVGCVGTVPDGGYAGYVGCVMGLYLIANMLGILGV